MPAPVLDRPEPAEYSQRVGRLLAFVPDGDLLEILAAQARDLLALVNPLSEEVALTHHAPYTWSIKQVAGHLMDSERIFGYRAMWLARNGGTPVPSFDENGFVASADFDRCKMADLTAEFDLLRKANLALFKSLSAEAWLRTGTINNQSMTPRAVACVMTGHVQHHLNILHARLNS